MILFSRHARSSRYYGNREIKSAEVNAAAWRKSSFSNYAGNCVEIAWLPGDRVGIRDTKDREKGPILLFTRAEWTAFLSGAKGEEFDSI
jgi:hypothetical protein